MPTAAKGLVNPMQLSPSVEMELATHREVAKEAKKKKKEHWTPLRRKLDKALNSKYADVCISLLIMVNMLLLVLETDAVAAGTKPEAWIPIMDNVILFCYGCELVLRGYVHRWEFFTSKEDLADTLIVGIDALSFFIKRAGLPSTSMLRVFRLARLGRALRLLMLLPELHLIVKGLWGAMKAIFWGMLLVLLWIAILSIMSVQIIYPISRELADEGAYDGCDRCARAFSSVGQSILTYTQTILAGDSWGQVAIPIIERSPAAYFFFLLVLITVSVAIMNLILAVIVDAAQEARKAGDHELALMKEAQKKKAAETLGVYFTDMDKDGSGNITLDELKQGVQELEGFGAALLAMDISESDLDAVFHILDEDKSGDINCREFVVQLQKMKADDSHTLLVFVKYYVQVIHEKLSDQMNKHFAAQQELLQAEMGEIQRVGRFNAQKTFELIEGNISGLRAPASVDRSSPDISEREIALTSIATEAPFGAERAAPRVLEESVHATVDQARTPSRTADTSSALPSQDSSTSDSLEADLKQMQSEIDELLLQASTGVARLIKSKMGNVDTSLCLPQLQGKARRSSLQDKARDGAPCIVLSEDWRAGISRGRGSAERGEGAIAADRSERAQPAVSFKDPTVSTFSRV